MTLVITLTAELEEMLRLQAAAAGKDANTFASEALEEKLHGPRTLDEILAPFRKQVADSGMTDAEMDEFHESLREEVWQNRQDNRLQDPPPMSVIPAPIGAVYDCMIFLQAATNPGRVHSTFRLVESRAVSLYVSSDILAEVRDVLTRPRHKEKFPALTDDHVSRFLATIAGLSKLVENVPHTYTLNAGPNDSKYINLAVAAGVQFLVTWGRHLLNLVSEQTPEAEDFRQRFPSLQILDPVAFISRASNLRPTRP